LGIGLSLFVMARHVHEQTGSSAFRGMVEGVELIVMSCRFSAHLLQR